jgi:hypothetical protein
MDAGIVIAFVIGVIAGAVLTIVVAANVLLGDVPDSLVKDEQ